MPSSTSAEYLVISGSLNPASNSRLLAEQLYREFHPLNVNAELADLRNDALPLCDGSTAYGHPSVAVWGQRIRAARVIIIATPIYNYDATAAVKNLIELTGKAWEGKVVGFLCAAGGQASYMSIMALAGSLMLDFRCLIIPRFVYTTGDDFSDTAVTTEKVALRLKHLAEAAIQTRNAPAHL